MSVTILRCSSFWGNQSGVTDLLLSLIPSNSANFMDETSYKLIDHILGHMTCKNCLEPTLPNLKTDIGQTRYNAVLLLSLFKRFCKARLLVTSKKGKLSRLVKSNIYRCYSYTLSMLGLEYWIQLDPLIAWVESLEGAAADVLLMSTFLDQLRLICQYVANENDITYRFRLCPVFGLEVQSRFRRTSMQQNVSENLQGSEETMDISDSETIIKDTSDGEVPSVITRCLCDEPYGGKTLAEILDSAFINYDDSQSGQDLDVNRSSVTPREDNSVSSESEHLAVGNTTQKTRLLKGRQPTLIVEKVEADAIKISPIKNGLDKSVVLEHSQNRTCTPSPKKPTWDKSPRRKEIKSPKKTESPCITRTGKDMWSLAEETKLYVIMRALTKKVPPRSRDINEYNWDEIAKEFAEDFPRRNAEGLRRKWYSLRRQKSYLHNNIRIPLQKKEKNAP